MSEGVMSVNNATVRQVQSRVTFTQCEAVESPYRDLQSVNVTHLRVTVLWVCVFPEFDSMLAR